MNSDVTPAHLNAAVEIHEEIAGLLRSVTGETEIGPHTRLDADLLLDSLELAALGSLLHERYGVDLPAFIAGLTLDEIIELSVAQVAGFVEAHANRQGWPTTEAMA